MWKYRVNYGNGQVSERFPTQGEAYAHLDSLTHYKGFAFVQKHDGDDWFAVAAETVRDKPDGVVPFTGNAEVLGRLLAKQLAWTQRSPHDCEAHAFRVATCRPLDRSNAEDMAHVAAAHAWINGQMRS